MIKKVLTIAGSDAGGGAGIQADLKTFQEFGTYGLSSLTSILTVDPAAPIPSIHPIPLEVVEKQLATAFSGGALAAVKIGLLGSSDVVTLIESYLTTNRQTKVVLDPVMAVKGNNDLLQPELVSAMIDALIPLADVITPNLVEAQILSGISHIETKTDMKKAAQKIHQLGAKSVVIKGGARFPGEIATDLFFDGTVYHFYEQAKLATDTNHGAGCSFAAAITASLARNISLNKAIGLAKNYVREAIDHGLYLNDFTGYVWHGAYFQTDTRLNKYLNEQEMPHE